MERRFLDFSLPGSECSTERKFHGSESSLYGLFAPGNESAEERKGQLPVLLAPAWDSSITKNADSEIKNALFQFLKTVNRKV